jgi:transcriptional regulator with XRE-family HTH domain
MKGRVMATPSIDLSTEERSKVVTKAFLRASEALGMSRQDIAAVLGISEASLSRLFQGERHVDAALKEGEIARYFLRLYRSLDSLFGGSRENSIKWFSSPNRHLNGVPANLVKTIGGLVEVTGYLDAMRGKV